MDITSVNSVSRVDKDVSKLRSEILCCTFCPLHGEGPLDEGPTRIHYGDVLIEVEIWNVVIQSLEDHGIWSDQVTREAHNGVAKVHARGDIHV
jgi:hypothetical protein